MKLKKIKKLLGTSKCVETGTLDGNRFLQVE
jgi:tRNA U55 pseudouridine synthase TruB